MQKPITPPRGKLPRGGATAYSEGSDKTTAADEAGLIIGGVHIADDYAHGGGGGVNKLPVADVNADMRGPAGAGAGLFLLVLNEGESQFLSFRLP